MITFIGRLQPVSKALRRACVVFIITNCSLLITHDSSAQTLTLVELNCENLFDCRHDTLKQDTEWLPASMRHWTPSRYWRKVNGIGQTILSCQEEGVPDLVALVEVENDSCLFDLTRKSLLRHAGYQYIMTESPDVRGIDVALLYQPFKFRPLCYDYLAIEPLEGMRPTRDILYIEGEYITGDTLHVFVVHAPSRFGGERATRPNRQLVADRLVQTIRQLPPDAKVIVVGDFNDDAEAPALRYLERHALRNITREAQGTHGAEGTYRYQGEWGSIDHVFVCPWLLDHIEQVYINDTPFLLEEDKKYGGVKPLRTYQGPRYLQGFSDHLPLVVRFRL
ncbi:MAG: endonuclease/exonuclease/phosphatase family protein [Prevotella sp.]|nr:endonuclease/exonuclease/phosphatase family protein [Prevotella sp.]